MKTMDIIICTDPQGGIARLTTDSPASHYGIPVLRVEAEDVSGDFGPADLIGDIEKPDKLITAAQVVAGWASKPERTKAEIETAASFLRQWPEGPQI